jgi:hypothetical protein
LIACALAACGTDGANNPDPTTSDTTATHDASEATADTVTAPPDVEEDTSSDDAPTATTPADTNADDTRADTPDAEDAEDAEDTQDTTPPPPLLALYPFSDNRAHPESVAFDPTERAFYTGSLGDGSITRTRADGTQANFFTGNDAGEWLVLGLEVDAQRRRLWACAGLGRDLTESELWMFDLNTGQRVWQTSLQGVHEGAVCSDVALNTDGTAFASDRASGNIYLIDPEAQSITIWTWNPLLEPEIIGQNGIDYTEDGRYLLVVKFLPARLMRVSLQNPSDVQEVALSGDGFLAGADAVAAFGGSAYVATDSALLRVSPTSDVWTTGQAKAIGYVSPTGQTLSGFSGVTVAEGALYASKSDVVRLAIGIAPRLPFVLLRVEPAAFD